MYTGRLLPVTTPFTFHWYCGAAPPLIPTAEKVTGLLMQTGFRDGLTDTLTGMTWLTVIVMVLEVAYREVVHIELDVMAQVTTSPFAGWYE